MDRLTERTSCGAANLAYPKSCYFQGGAKDPVAVSAYRQLAIDRLAAYEDTGLEPEEIERIVDAYGRGHTLRSESAERLEIIREIKTDRLRELAKAENDGLLVMLPSKTVWELTWDAGPDCDLVCPVSIDGNGCCDFCDKGKLFVYERTCAQDCLKEIGKTVFLTREEAEAALAEKGGTHETDPV